MKDEFNEFRRIINERPVMDYSRILNNVAFGETYSGYKIAMENRPSTIKAYLIKRTPSDMEDEFKKYESEILKTAEISLFSSCLDWIHSNPKLNRNNLAAALTAMRNYKYGGTIKLDPFESIDITGFVLSHVPDNALYFFSKITGFTVLQMSLTTTANGWYDFTRSGKAIKSLKLYYSRAVDGRFETVGLTGLRNLDLGRSSLAAIPGGIDVRNLKSLNLAYCHNIDIEKVAISGLKSLGLRGNKKALRLSLFERTGKLRELDISKCELDRMPLMDGKNLATLDISENELKRLNGTIMMQFPRLAKLDVSYNKIEKISRDAGLPYLREIYIRGNGLSREKDLTRLNASEVLDVRGNKLGNLERYKRKMKKRLPNLMIID